MIDRSIVRNRKGVSQTEQSQVLEGYIALEEVYHLMDIAQVELESATGKPVCISSCGKCCEGNTPVVTRLEADYVLSTMSVLPSYQDLRQKALEWMARKRPGEKLADVKKSQCAFLNDSDKTCMIYDYRPIECRAYGVNQPAEPMCPRPLHYTEKDDNRMLVTSDTPLGKRINQSFVNLKRTLGTLRPDLFQKGLLPVFIGKEMISQAKFNNLVDKGEIQLTRTQLDEEKTDD